MGVGPVGSIGKTRAVPDPPHRRRERQGLPARHPGRVAVPPCRRRTFKVEYFGNAEASAKKCNNGWLHMGDIVRQDDEGWLYYEYRKGGGIRHNGEFISCAAVEKSNRRVRRG